MTRQKRSDHIPLTIHLSPATAKELKIRAVEKYGSYRAFSQLIEDMARETRTKA